jgi:hypothetical protein
MDHKLTRPLFGWKRGWRWRSRWLGSLRLRVDVGPVFGRKRADMDGLASPSGLGSALGMSLGLFKNLGGAKDDLGRGQLGGHRVWSQRGLCCMRQGLSRI